MRAFFMLFGLMIAALLAVYFAVSVYFCSAPFNGDFRGCASMSGADMLGSTTAQLAAVGCLASLVYAATQGRRR